MKIKPVIFSIGHSSKPLTVFLNKLADHKIDILADVRSIPISRYCPHFNANALRKALVAKNIQYLWRGKNLGGRGINKGYEEAIDEIAALAKDGEQVCVMCSEGDYKKCHRYLILTPSLRKRGLSVIHIEYENDTNKRTHKRK